MAPNFAGTIDPERSATWHSWVPHVCLFLANVGSRSKNKSLRRGLDTSVRGRVPHLENREMSGTLRTFARDLRAGRKIAP